MTGAQVRVLFAAPAYAVDLRRIDACLPALPDAARFSQFLNGPCLRLQNGHTQGGNAGHAGHMHEAVLCESLANLQSIVSR